LKRIAYVTHCTISKDTLHLVQDSIGLDFLSIRRDLKDVMFVYDIFNKIIDYLEMLSLIGFRLFIKKTRNSDLFYIPKFKTNYGKNSFFTRALLNANKISTVLDFFNIFRHIF
jgi:hypothetical protein